MTLCSVATVAGVIGVIALVKGLMFRRRMMHFAGGFGGHEMSSGCGHRGWGRWGRGRWGRWGGGDGGLGRSFWLRALFSRLDTTPGQEKEIRSAIEDFRNTARAAKEELGGSREALAKAMTSETFDEIAVGEASVKLDGTTAKVKDAFEGALRRIHAVLDAKQRERLAEIIAKGPRAAFAGGGGPYRSVEL